MAAQGAVMAGDRTGSNGMGADGISQEPARRQASGGAELDAFGPTPKQSVAGLLAALEALSRARPDRVLRLTGSLPSAAGLVGTAATAAVATPTAGADGPLPAPSLSLPSADDPSRSEPPLPAAGEPFELLIFRGFSSLTTHPTAFDPDRAALPETARISSAELLAAPLDPDGGVPLAGPASAEAFLAPESWA